MNTETGRAKDTRGLPVLVVIGLALMAVPRAVAHDLELVGPVVNAILVFAPLAIWVAVALWRRVPRVFVTLLTVGLVYGVLLAVTHQILWAQSFDTAPSLGGNLAGRLSPGTEELVFRVFSVGSSIMTGVLVGAATGALAWLIARLVPGFRPEPRGDLRRSPTSTPRSSPRIRADVGWRSTPCWPWS